MIFAGAITTPISGRGARCRLLPLIAAAAFFSAADLRAAPFAYVTNGADSTVSVIDMATNAVVSTIPVGPAGAEGVALNLAGTRAYVTNPGVGTLSVINTASNAVIATVSTQDFSPSGVAIDPLGAKAYIANQSSVAVVDTTTNAVVTLISSFGGTSNIGAVAINGSGTRAYVSSYTSGRVAVVNTTTNTLLTQIFVGDNPIGVALNPSGSRLYVTDGRYNYLSVIDTNTNAVLTRVVFGFSAGSPAVNPAGSRLYVPDWVNSTISVLDTATNTLVGTITGGLFRPRAIAIDSTGTRAYVVNEGNNTVSVIDMSSSSVVGTIPVGRGPRGIALVGASTAPIASLAPVVTISAGSFHTCGVSSTGATYCWGENETGAVGDGTTTDRFVPLKIAQNMATVSAGGFHSCGIGTDGNVKCWGDNRNGQLGDGSFTNRLTPVSGGGAAIGVSTGGFHTCAITPAGSVRCWGGNGLGQLGDGTTATSALPVSVGGLTAVTSIGTGFSHSCALTSTGLVRCWGDNRFGQLGDGTLTNRSAPVSVAGLSGSVVALAVGGYHACALAASGAVQCWGSNENGQLGDGSTTNRSTAVTVPQLAAGGAKAIAGGGFHTCVLFTGGAVGCWGSNTFGQIGDGTAVNRPSPTAVTGLGRGILAVSAGGYESCAVLSDGGVRCWGSNRNGQLGDGGLSSHGIPQAVVGVAASGYLDLSPEDPVQGPPVIQQTFAMTVRGSVAGSAATVTADVQFRPQDNGKRIFVFAHGPRSILKGTRVAPLRPNDGPETCGVGQITPGASTLHEVTSATNLASVTNAVASANNAVTILDGVSTAQLGGATFCVAAANSGTEALATGNNRCAVTIPGSAACLPPDEVAVAANAPAALSGVWWNKDESGWGINFTQRKNVVFAAWYTYDSAGAAKWYVAPNCPLSGGSGPNTGGCSSTLYEVTNPTFFGAFNPAASPPVVAGSMQLSFQTTDAAVLTYTVGAQTRVVSIIRQVFATGTTPPIVDYTDLWWNTAESGWGLAVTQQYMVMFLAWYIYDTSGKPVWYVSTCAVTSAQNGCTGPLFRTTGPPLGPTFNPALVHAAAVGTASLLFSNANNGTLSYTVNGFTSSKLVTRQIF